MNPTSFDLGSKTDVLKALMALPFVVSIYVCAGIVDAINEL